MPSGDSADALREVWMEGYNRGLSESGRKSVERADKAQDEVARLACENAALRKRVEECEAEHPPEREYVEWCEAGKPDVAALRKRVEEAESKIAEMLSDKDDYWSLAKCSNCGVLLNCNGSQREHEWVWKARAEKAERERDEAIDERDVLMEAHQALGHEYEMQGRALDDYRAKAIQRQQDFDGAAHGCDVLQGNLDALQADLDAALVLCVASDWDVEVLGAGYEPEVYKAHAHVLALLEKRREENRG